jgi:P27 family predicted phage terminase small subunit
MGRRPDTPAMQAAKGSPGKRMSKADRAQAEAARVASMIAAAPAELGDALAPPQMMLDPRLAPAIAVWRELVPELRSMNILKSVDRLVFAMFCLLVADYWAARKDVLENGHYTWWQPAHGNKKRIKSPAADDAVHLTKVILDMAKEYALTPLARYALLREQSAHGVVTAHQSADAHGAAPSTAAADDDDLIGLAARRNSPAPTLQ